LNDEMAQAIGENIKLESLGSIQRGLDEVTFEKAARDWQAGKPNLKAGRNGKGLSKSLPFCKRPEWHRVVMGVFCDNRLGVRPDCHCGDILRVESGLGTVANHFPDDGFDLILQIAHPPTVAVTANHSGLCAEFLQAPSQYTSVRFFARDCISTFPKHLPSPRTPKVFAGDARGLRAESARLSKFFAHVQSLLRKVDRTTGRRSLVESRP